MRVLIVEDDELLREIYATKFEMEGYEVLTAADGGAGLEAALAHMPDLIILDNLMPRLTGLELLESYRAAQPAGHPVIIFLSNKSSLDDMNRAKRLGATEYLIKANFTPGELVARVKGHLASLA